MDDKAVHFISLSQWLVKVSLSVFFQLFGHLTPSELFILKKLFNEYFKSFFSTPSPKVNSLCALNYFFYIGFAVKE